MGRDRIREKQKEYTYERIHASPDHARPRPGTFSKEKTQALCFGSRIKMKAGAQLAWDTTDLAPGFVEEIANQTKHIAH